MKLVEDGWHLGVPYEGITEEGHVASDSGLYDSILDASAIRLSNFLVEKGLPPGWAQEFSTVKGQIWRLNDEIEVERAALASAGCKP